MREHARFSKGLYAWIGFKSIGVPFDVEARAHGDSKFSYRKLTHFALDGLMSFSTMPLKVWSYIGSATSLAGADLGGFYLIRTLIFGVDVPGYASLIVSITFFAGIQLLSLGIIGEYIGRIFAEVKRRPLYLVEERMGIGLLATRTIPGPAAFRSKSKTLMYKSLVSVGGLTLLSRGAGFLRDVLLGAVLGAGQLNDAFVVAQRLPNHFRTIFGEGAFNSAYVPSYALCFSPKVLPARGSSPGRFFWGCSPPRSYCVALALAFTPYCHRSSRAWFPRGSGKIRAYRHADADHLSLSSVRHPRDAAIWHVERAWPFHRRGIHAGRDEFIDDCLPRSCFSVRQSRLGGELGADRLRSAAARADLGSRSSRRNFRALRAPGDDEAHQAFPCDAWARR